MSFPVPGDCSALIHVAVRVTVPVRFPFLTMSAMPAPVFVPVCCAHASLYLLDRGKDSSDNRDKELDAALRVLQHGTMMTVVSQQFLLFGLVATNSGDFCFLGNCCTFRCRSCRSEAILLSGI